MVQITIKILFALWWAMRTKMVFQCNADVLSNFKLTFETSPLENDKRKVVQRRKERDSVCL